MRIGLVCPYSLDAPGGVQNQVLGLAAWLHSQGHEAFVLAPGQVGRDHQLHGFPRCRITTVGGAVPVAFNGSVARISLGATVPVKVRKWFDRHALDVVNIHEPLVPLTSLAALHLAKIPTVATFHASGFGSTVSMVSRAIRRRLQSLSAATTVSRTSARSVTQSTGICPQVVSNGLFTDDFHPGDVGPWRGGDRPRITFLGRLDEPRKGFPTFVSAASLFRRSWPETIVTVVGRGDTGVPSWMERTGELNDHARDRLLERTDVLIAPNSGQESFGLILVEALSAGAAVVASDLPAFREVLTGIQGTAGTLVPPHDAAEFADAIGATLHCLTGEHRRFLRKHAEQFDWRKAGPRYLDVYSAVLAQAVT